LKMKKKEFREAVKTMSRDELVAKARSLSEELMKLRFRKASGQLEQVKAIPQLRRDLARVKTALSYTDIKINSSKSA
jgi:large subunit ribosomal protein L29